MHLRAHKQNAKLLSSDPDVGFTLDPGGDRRLESFFVDFVRVEAGYKKTLPLLKLLPRINILHRQSCGKFS